MHSKQFESVCFCKVKDNDMLPCFRHIKPSYTIYRYCSALSIRMRMSTFITITTGSVPFKHNENTYQKGRVLMQMYRVVPQTKRGNSLRSSKRSIHNTKYKVKVILCASEHICSIVRYCFRSFTQL